MSDAIAYACADSTRRTSLSQHAALTGIDFVEVSEDQHSLFLHFVPPSDSVAKDPIPAGITVDAIEITGGTRITKIRVTEVTYPPAGENILTVTVDDDDDASPGVGDFSPYMLSLIGVANVDRLFSSVAFSFKANCASDFDCRPDGDCPPPSFDEPLIDYMAKDYASFRRIIFDRLATIAPEWRERNPADLGVTLVELLAYVGDYLSYRQDAVATEAYLSTARLRTSVRRHARLVDYFMHDGCNARVWVQLKSSVDGVLVQRHPTPPGDPKLQPTKILTRIPNIPTRIAPDSSDLDEALAASPEVFELMHDIIVRTAHDRMTFYAWESRECCLPIGATSATLKGTFSDLTPGDVLIFAEERDPGTGLIIDADPAHRHAVRLTKVISEENGLPLLDELNGTPITEIEWDEEDALPFTLCISAETNIGYSDEISVALGNIALADHGGTIVAPEELGVVPEPKILGVVGEGGDCCEKSEPAVIQPRYRPTLEQGPLTQAGTVARFRMIAGRLEEERIAFDPEASATAAFAWEMREVRPAIELTDEDGTDWTPQRDLLSSESIARDYVVEMETDGIATLRFGDDVNGRRPDGGESFTARYRVGNGMQGNVGAESLAHVVTGVPEIIGVVNPMPARGGVDPETIRQVRRDAPVAFRTQERAVTPDDYARVAERHPGVQRAAATFRWTGSWRTVFLTIDRIGGKAVDEEFEEEMRLHIERYRMAGHDIEIDGPHDVGLEIEMHVCVEPDYRRSDIRRELTDVFSNRDLPGNRRGLFHPDNFTFGQRVYLSPLYAAAQRIAGVQSVEITLFQRLDRPGTTALDTGGITLDRLEIARLDNDPSFPERGVIRLDVEGGR